MGECTFRPQGRKGAPAGIGDRVVKCDIETGRKGEDIALEWLLGRGFLLLERNWRWGHKEIDLIVESERFLHIVEVKTLLQDICQEPQMRIDAIKIRNLAVAAGHYARLMRVEKEICFDVVAVKLYADPPQVEYIPEAFYPIF